MSNIFLKSMANHDDFSWDKLGNIKEGRYNLGDELPVIVYRLFEYSMNDVLVKELGKEKAIELFRKTGYKAGSEYAKNALDLTLPLNEFVAQLQKSLENLKVGILRIEEYDDSDGKFILTVAEDLDCSGLPPTDEHICNYDEGFIQAIFEVYTGKKYEVREIDCWASGARVCRFKGVVIE